jgi:hypothetical protein
MTLFKVPKKSKEEKLLKLTAAQRAQLEEIEAEAIADFEGDPSELESAIGVLRIGHHVGWKVLYLMHSKRTIRNYEKILTGSSKTPVRIRDLFKETGPSTYRSGAYRLVESLSNFWKAVSGETKLPERRTLSK